MLKIVIVEDVHDNIETLKHMLNESKYDYEIVAIADNLKDAKTALEASNIDVAFLDIQLKDGMIFGLLEELKRLGGLDFELVFTTAFSNFEMAIKAIQCACLDYLTKPLQQDRLNQVLAKIAAQKNNGTQNKQLNILLEAVKHNFEYPQSISVALPKGVMEIVAIDSILYLQADKNTCIFRLSDDRKLHSIKTFAYYLELFSNHPDFIQINRSNAINKKKVKRYNHRSKEISLNNNEVLIVSHRMSQMVKEALSNSNSSIEILQNLFGNLFKRSI